MLTVQLLGVTSITAVGILLCYHIENAFMAIQDEWYIRIYDRHIR